MSDLQRVLDVKMRQALQDLRQLSTVPAAVLGPRIQNAEASHAPTGGYDPWDKLTPEMLARLYDACISDHERLTVIVQVRAEVKAIKKGPEEKPEGEDEVATRKRIVAETAGNSPEEVADLYNPKMLARTIRKWRLMEGLDPLTGYPRTDLTLDKKKVEAVRLWVQGNMSQAEIAEALGLYREQVKRAINQAQQGAEAA